MHVVCAWIGNSEPVAAKHYLQLTDEHFEKGIRGGHEAAQNPAQYAHESGRKTWKPNPEHPAFSEKHDPLRCYTNVELAEAGLEPARGITPQDFKS